LTSPDLRFVVCVKGNVNVDLEPFRVYKVKRDAAARRDGLLRVVDESGEDYLYPARYFQPIVAPARLFQLAGHSREVLRRRGQGRHSARGR
jgi:hypothetical protein